MESLSMPVIQLWPQQSRPGRHVRPDGAGREWCQDFAGRWWIKAGALWYPSFPESMTVRRVLAELGGAPGG